MSFTYGTFPRPMDTKMDPEEFAYPAGSLRQSRRYGKAICSDGVVRSVKLGIADTFFTVPARCTIKGKTVSGYVSDLPTDLRLAPDAPENAGEILAFYPSGKHKELLTPTWYDVSESMRYWRGKITPTVSEEK